MRIVIIGRSDAGISAGLRAREGDSSIEVKVLLADSFPNYSICGLPFYISGETSDWPPGAGGPGPPGRRRGSRPARAHPDLHPAVERRAAGTSTLNV
jgi:NADPH-dependent 2,4-dienoyl-CoA reductase/sulfur reductase-like enzyme